MELQVRDINIYKKVGILKCDLLDNCWYILAIEQEYCKYIDFQITEFL